jgi:Fe-S-cluster-containing dehydrogenase component
MARFGMVIDTKKCVGCMDCVVACKTENNVPSLSAVIIAIILLVLPAVLQVLAIFMMLAQ